jgi:hypothetical protein
MYQAAEAYRAALEEWRRDRVPLDWVGGPKTTSATHCRGSGKAGAGPRGLEEAATAFDACLTVTGTAWPEEWARQVRSHRDETCVQITRRPATK